MSCYILRAIRAGRCRERRCVDPHIYPDLLQTAPFRSQIFKIFFASGGKGALTPLTKILRTFVGQLVCRERAFVCNSRVSLSLIYVELCIDCAAAAERDLSPTGCRDAGCLQCYCLQCFDAVGWVAGRASGL